MPDGPPTPPLSPDHALDWPGRTATAEAVLAAVEQRRLARGEFSIYIPFAISEIAGLRGLPVKAIIPVEGAPYVPFAYGMLRDAPAWANAVVAAIVAVVAVEWPLRSGLFLAIFAGALVATLMTRPGQARHAA